MSINSAYVIQVAPELSAEDPARIDFFIEQASYYINRKFWLEKSNYAHALFTAHLMLVAGVTTGSGGSSGAGLVSSEKVGDLQINYASPNNLSANSYSTTKYGNLFEQLLRTINVSPIVSS